MKHIGLALLVIGIGITAAYGARNPAEVDARTALGAQASNAAAAVSAAHATYCEGILENKLAAQDDCPAHEEADEASMAMAMPDDVVSAREAWQVSVAASEELGAQLSAMAPPAAGARLGAWFKLSGMPFLLGLIFVVAGSLISRKALKDEMESGADSKGGGGGPVDFGQKLSALAADVKALAEEMASQGGAAEQAEMDSVRERIETFQLEGFEPLIEARVQVQARHGLAGFAAVFGPLSSAERFVNRAWSALVDDHWPEASASVTNAARELDAAHGEIEKLSAK